MVPACKCCRGDLSRGSGDPYSLVLALKVCDMARRPGADASGEGYPFAAGWTQGLIQRLLEERVGVHVECLIGRLAGALLLQRSRIALGLVLPHTIIWTGTSESIQ